MNPRKFITALAAICGLAWVVAAIQPFDRQAWFLENILLVIFVVTLSLTHRRLQLSNASYFFLAAFVILHIVGAHYTYAQMPIGHWTKDFFHLSRNHYDRFAHGAFGFFLAYLFVSSCSNMAEFIARGVFGSPPALFSPSAVSLKSSKALSRRSSRPDRELIGLAAREMSGTRSTICSRPLPAHSS